MRAWSNSCLEFVLGVLKNCICTGKTARVIYSAPLERINTSRHIWLHNYSTLYKRYPCHFALPFVSLVSFYWGKRIDQSHKSQIHLSHIHNTSHWNRKVSISVLVYCGVWNRWIMGFVRLVYCCPLSMNELWITMVKSVNTQPRKLTKQRVPCT